MNTLPSLNDALSSSFNYRGLNTTQNSVQMNEPKPKRISIINSTPTKLVKQVDDDFKPMKIIGRIDLSSHLRSNSAYAWTHIVKEANPDPCKANSSTKEAESTPTRESRMVSVNEEHSTEEDKENKDIMAESDSQKESEKDSDDMKNLNEQSWLWNTKGSRLKPKAIHDKKLAVRSDVVNKTLLRSLKRYYTAEFENFSKFKLQSKSTQKNEIYAKLIEFTTKIYEDDDRFKQPEFSKVTMSDVIFYMGICINPAYMKKNSGSSSDRNKYHNFYSCLYKYSHK